MSATARRRRTEAMECGTCRSGRIGGAARPEALGWRRCLPLLGEAPPRGEKAALGGQEAVGCDAEAGVVVEAAPAAALVVPEADLLLQVLVIALDHPARLGGMDQVAERGSGRRVGEPVLGRLLRSEEHTSELQSRQYLVCRLLL